MRLSTAGWVILTLSLGAVAYGDDTCPIGDDLVLRLSQPALVFVWPKPYECPGEDWGVDCEHPSFDQARFLSGLARKMRGGLAGSGAALLSCRLSGKALTLEVPGPSDNIRITVEASWAGVLVVCPGRQVQYRIDRMEAVELQNGITSCLQALRGRRTRG